ncbi:MAG: hypothetical protein U0U70_02250 [Chitinophagaceae bacterium]
MNINRHNYEEYFILYMDNELTGDERRMVEAFVQQHPDLKEELDNLLQYKLVPDTSIVFEGKEDLLKENGHSLITANNYEEWLTLYIDNELDEEQRQQVEHFLAMTPAALNELTLLQQTKLPPEEIVFTGKDSLYRYEEKVRRIPVWGRRAAAAILILAIGIPAALWLTRKQPGTGSENGVAKTFPKNTGTTPSQNNSVPPPVKEANNIAAEEKDTPGTSPFVAEAAPKNNASPEKKKENNTVALITGKQPLPENKQDDKVLLPENRNEQAVAQNKPEQKPSNNLPVPVNNPNLSDNKKNDAIAYNPPAEIKNDSKLSDPVVTKNNASPSDYTQAVYNPDNKTELEQPDGKKNKNRGLFRKIARTFQKRTNIDPTDEDRLLVGGLAIKLK